MVSGGVQPGEDMIRLELTVDKTELERQLNQVFGKAQGPAAVGGAAPTDLGAIVGKKPSGVTGALEGIKATSGTGGKGLPITAGQGMLKVLGPIAALTGISLSVAGILKLSKLAGSMLGALSSVIGAMIDSFLAPFMPMMAKGISWLARKGIPAAIEAGKKTYDWLAKVWERIDGPVIFYLKSQLKKIETLIDIIKLAFKVNEKMKEGQDKIVQHLTQDVPGFWKQAFKGGGQLELGPVGKFLKGFIPGMDKGGVVPGRPGSPQLVLARGQEEYLGVGGGRRSRGGGLVLQPTFNFEITAENSVDATRQILKELEPEILELVSRQFFTMQAQFSRV